MAYAVAYTMLGDAHLAEDVAQEAFIEAYICLPKLREPAAFPGWFRRIVHKRGDRLVRGKAPALVSLELPPDTVRRPCDPSAAAERASFSGRCARRSIGCRRLIGCR